MRFLIDVVADFSERKLDKVMDAEAVAETLELKIQVGDKCVIGKIEKLTVEELDYKEI